MTTSEHHLVTVTRLWASAPAVVGIFTTREAAETAVRDARGDGSSPDSYSIETWLGIQHLETWPRSR
ncbi:hypothetical protein [Rathayibacter sp. AY1A7]|uniref:hypothetical protein n=1 Tax=Rathayibacter sp. AY1A7 TaxID=2080524 RepID=UPI000CE775FE|nr:hypothetical protein [Rathayibacter sp. AY1A7]PPF20583.1 hypothetical protein C5B95_07480 [Rathayibacter sp. AY1A7]